jgi:hypothetical protein
MNNLLPDLLKEPVLALVIHAIGSRIRLSPFSPYSGNGGD